MEQDKFNEPWSEYYIQFHCNLERLIRYSAKIVSIYDLTDLEIEGLLYVYDKAFEQAIQSMQYYLSDSGDCLYQPHFERMLKNAYKNDIIKDYSGWKSMYDTKKWFYDDFRWKKNLSLVELVYMKSTYLFQQLDEYFEDIIYTKICDTWKWHGDFHENITRIMDEHNLYGYITNYGRIVSPCMWDEAKDFNEDLAVVKKNGKYGLIDTHGLIVSPCQWSSIGIFERTFTRDKACALIKNNNSYGLIDKNGDVITPCQWDRIGYFTNGALPVSKNGKIGFIDDSGKIISACLWEEVDEFNSLGVAFVRKTKVEKSDDKWGWDGFINKEGEYTEYKAWHPSMYRSFKEGNKYGYKNMYGELISPCIWEDVDNFYDGMARVKQNGKYGFINEHGTLVIPCIWEYAGYFYDGMAEIKQNKKYGIIDKNGSLISDCKWSSIKILKGSVAIVQNTDGKYGLLNIAGETISECQWDWITDRYNGFLEIGKNTDNKHVYGLLDKLGTVVVPCEYGSVGDFHEGLVKVWKNGLYGFVDKSGTLVIDCKLDRAGDFHEGLAQIRKNGSYGYIDKLGNNVIEAQWDAVGNFHGGYAWALLNKKLYLLDRMGNVRFFNLPKMKCMGFNDYHACLIGAKKIVIDKTGRQIGSDWKEIQFTYNSFYLRSIQSEYYFEDCLIEVEDASGEDFVISDDGKVITDRSRYYKDYIEDNKDPMFQYDQTPNRLLNPWRRII